MKIRRRTVLMVLNRSGMKSFTFTVCEPITIIFKSNKNNYAEVKKHQRCNNGNVDDYDSGRLTRIMKDQLRL